MRNDKDILASVENGYYGRHDDGMWSSPCWLAARAGEILRATGASVPVRAHMSRGCAVRVQTFSGEYVVRLSGKQLTEASVERV